jgi:hypothetical protein
MSKLPQTGDANWGDTLNTFLTTTHLNDETAESGKLKKDLSTIVAGGKVGIGHPNPQAMLQVANQGVGQNSSVLEGQTFFIGSEDGSYMNYGTNEDTYIRGGKNASRIIIGDTNNGGVEIGYGSNSPAQTNDVSISSNGKTVMATGTGKVGIGTGNPVYAKLQIANGDDTISAVRIEGSNNPNTLLSLGGTGKLSVDAPGIGGGRFIIQDNGNVGIGTPYPAAKLNVNGGDQTVGIKIDSTGGDKYLQIQRDNGGSEFMRIGGAAGGTAFGGANNSYFFDLISPNSIQARPLNIRSSTDGGTTYNSLMYIDTTSSGNVGIGTDAPTSKLSVVGLQNFSTNALAISSGLKAGDFYHNNGVLMVVF